MNSRKRYGVNLPAELRPMAAGVLLMAVALTAGCRSAGYVKSNVAAVNLQAVAEAVRTEGRNLSTATTTLNNLVNAPSGDLRPSLERFSQALDQLEASKKQTASVFERLGHKKATYLEAWDKQVSNIQDEELRKRSATRRTEVSNQYDSASHTYQESQNALTPLIGYLKDIRKALSTDLTTSGLAAVNPEVSSANNKAAAVQTQLAQSASALDALGVSMASFAAGGTK